MHYEIIKLEIFKKLCEMRYFPSGFITATSLITAQNNEAVLILNTRWQLGTSDYF